MNISSFIFTIIAIAVLYKVTKIVINFISFKRAEKNMVKAGQDFFCFLNENRKLFYSQDVLLEIEELIKLKSEIDNDFVKYKKGIKDAKNKTISSIRNIDGLDVFFQKDLAIGLTKVFYQAQGYLIELKFYEIKFKLTDNLFYLLCNVLQEIKEDKNYLEKCRAYLDNELICFQKAKIFRNKNFAKEVKSRVKNFLEFSKISGINNFYGPLFGIDFANLKESD